VCTSYSSRGDGTWCLLLIRSTVSFICCSHRCMESLHQLLLLCRHRHEIGRCPYSSVTAADGSGNHCIHAHSAAELDEWKERYNWRQSRKMAAKQQHLYSYMAALHDEYINDDTDTTVSLMLLLLCLSLLLFQIFIVFLSSWSWSRVLWSSLEIFVFFTSLPWVQPASKKFRRRQKKVMYISGPTPTRKVISETDLDRQLR